MRCLNSKKHNQKKIAKNVLEDLLDPRAQLWDNEITLQIRVMTIFILNFYLQ